jgi:hypothetical protein
VTPATVEGLTWNLRVGQIVLLLLLLSGALPLIVTTTENGGIAACLLLCFVSIAGLLCCRHTEVRLGDSSLRLLGYFWLAKLAITLFLLYVGWIPQLDPASSPVWGYDPQRYYSQAQELIDNEWSPEFLSLNYVGILFYYGAVLRLFGRNPVAPALVNASVTLIASLYLVWVGYEIKQQRDRRDWTLALALLLPELLWFDVMTSRETLIGALLLIAMLTAGRYLARTTSLSLTTALVVSTLAIVAVATVRTSMVLPVFCSVALMALLIRPHHGSRLMAKSVLALAAGMILLAAPMIAHALGGYEFDIVAAIRGVTTGVSDVALTDTQWSKNSIGMLLLPSSMLQSVLFAPFRIVLYVVAPLPNLAVSASGLFGGSWESWQRLFTVPSSLINVIAFPYALASFLDSIRRRKENPERLVFHIPYWSTLVAIAAGNLIIHERYRVMATLLFWGCAWLGAQTAPKRMLARTTASWYGLLAIGALLYVSRRVA